MQRVGGVRISEDTGMEVFIRALHEYNIFIAKRAHSIATPIGTEHSRSISVIVEFLGGHPEFKAIVRSLREISSRGPGGACDTKVEGRICSCGPSPTPALGPTPGATSHVQSGYG